MAIWQVTQAGNQQPGLLTKYYLVVLSSSCHQMRDLQKMPALHTAICRDTRLLLLPRLQPWHMQAIVHNVHSATANRAMCSSLLCIKVHAAQRHSCLCSDLDFVMGVSSHVVHVAVLAALRPDDAPLWHALLQLRAGAAVRWWARCALSFCLLNICC